MDTINKNSQNRDLSEIQATARQYFGDKVDIMNLSPQQKAEMIDTLQKVISRKRMQSIPSNIGGAIGGAMQPLTSGKEFLVQPGGQISAVDVGVTPPGSKEPSALDELIQYEKYKQLREAGEEKKKEREKESAIIKAKYGITDETQPSQPELLQPQPEQQPESIPINLDRGIEPTSRVLPTGGMEKAPPIPKKMIPKQLPTGEWVEVENTNYDEEMAARKMWEERQKESREPRQKGKIKWSEEAAERQIKFEVLDPKLRNYMDVGGRAYQELRDTAKEYGIDLNFEEGGIEAIKAMITKGLFTKAKLAPLMVALERLRPELGTELMRQLGAFRSAAMAQRFAATLAQFSGDIREDIANMTTTMVKNRANVELVDEQGNIISPEETVERMNTAEANYIRLYNKMYRGMGLTTKPYTAQRSLEWLAKNSNFNKAEENIIQNAMADNPKYSRTEVAVELIKRGVL